MIDTDSTEIGSSYRDPSGVVLTADKRIFRAIKNSTENHFHVVNSSGILEDLASMGRIVWTRPLEVDDAPAAIKSRFPQEDYQLVEHERIPFISYPYEWPFSLLKRAAIHHLDLHLELLKTNFTLSDASAYNVQFRGVKPVFIDITSIRPYCEGEYWAGYRQFCEQFLNPLLLTSMIGVSHQSWFRGRPEGIPIQELAMLLPLRARLSWKVLLHIVLHASITAKAVGGRYTSSSIDGRVWQKPMDKTTFIWMLKGLRKWVMGLNHRSVGDTIWKNYSLHTNYTCSEMELKRTFITSYVQRRKPSELLDLGCNTCSYSQLALSAGANRVIGIDTDTAALENAVMRADQHALNLLPLSIDAVNPSPNQGWACREWQGFSDRLNADGLIALAFFHHICIGRNVPMSQAIDWIIAHAPHGVIEFVPKSDPMVKLMLRDRQDIFPNYHIDEFRFQLLRCSTIVRELAVSDSGRMLFEYQRTEEV